MTKLTIYVNWDEKELYEKSDLMEDLTYRLNEFEDEFIEWADKKFFNRGEELYNDIIDSIKYKCLTNELQEICNDFNLYAIDNILDLEKTEFYL